MNFKVPPPNIWDTQILHHDFPFLFEQFHLTTGQNSNLCQSRLVCMSDLGLNYLIILVGFVALRPKSTAMVIAGRSVHLTTLFQGRREQAVNQ